MSDRRWVVEECSNRVPSCRASAIALTNYGIARCQARLCVCVCVCVCCVCVYVVCVCVHTCRHVQVRVCAHKLKGRLDPRARQAALTDTSPLDDDADLVALRNCQEVLSRRLAWLEVYVLIYPGNSLNPERLRWFCESDNAQVARLLAQEEECHALRVLLRQYRAELAPVWLSILDNIPETCRPRAYESLLPACDQRYDGPRAGDGHRPGESDDGLGVVEAQEAAAWYVRRAQCIERRTGLVDNALELVELGQERLRGCAQAREALGGLRADLSHLYMLVYECGLHELTLVAWHNKNLMERLRCFTANSTTATFVTNVRDRAVCSLPAPTPGP